MPAKVGRPKIPKREALGRTLGARLRADEVREVLAAIRKSGLSHSEWIRQALLNSARRSYDDARQDPKSHGEKKAQVDS